MYGFINVDKISHPSMIYYTIGIVSFNLVKDLVLCFMWLIGLLGYTYGNQSQVVHNRIYMRGDCEIVC